MPFVKIPKDLADVKKETLEIIRTLATDLSHGTGAEE